MATKNKNAKATNENKNQVSNFAEILQKISSGEISAAEIKSAQTKAAEISPRSKSGAKASIYKKSAFENFSNQKTARRALRSKLLKKCRDIIKANEKELQIFALDFAAFYQETYILQDLSLSSCFDGNRESENAQTIAKALKILRGE